MSEKFIRAEEVAEVMESLLPMRTKSFVNSIRNFPTKGLSQ